MTAAYCNQARCLGGAPALGGDFGEKTRATVFSCCVSRCFFKIQEMGHVGTCLIFNIEFSFRLLFSKTQKLYYKTNAFHVHSNRQWSAKLLQSPIPLHLQNYPQELLFFLLAYEVWRTQWYIKLYMMYRAQHHFLYDISSVTTLRIGKRHSYITTTFHTCYNCGDRLNTTWCTAGRTWPGTSNRAWYRNSGLPRESNPRPLLR